MQMDVYEKDYRLRFQKVTVKDYGLILGGMRGRYKPLFGRKEGPLLSMTLEKSRENARERVEAEFLPSIVEICKRELQVPEE